MGLKAEGLRYLDSGRLGCLVGENECGIWDYGDFDLVLVTVRFGFLWEGGRVG